MYEENGPALPRKKGRWLLREPSVASKTLLFCLPYSGCGASMYGNWPRFIEDIEVCPIQLPGRESRLREQSYTTYEALASDLVAALRPYMDRPFAFFGHCGSALQGYEAARQLAQGGYPPPARLFVSSQVAPHQGPYGRFLHLTDEELASEVSAQMRLLGSEPVPDLIELYTEVLRADLEANKLYRLNAPVRLTCPLTAIGWSDDTEVSAQLMTGWSDYGETTFHLLKGEHYQFLQAPPDLLAVIAADLSLIA